MKTIFLTSSLGNYIKIRDNKIPSAIDNTNFILEKLNTICNKDTNILLISSNPLAFEKNDEMNKIMISSFNLSAINYKNIITLDSRNEKDIDSLILKSQIIILMGGHLPTQNNWFAKMNLKEKLKNFDGYLIGQSAGSMNCANKVYLCPEYEKEIDENKFPRWKDGLNLTSINILPHFNKYKDAKLGNLRMIEDIVIEDSLNHPIFALNDGSYIEIYNKQAILYGECFKIYNGQINKICSKNEKVMLDLV